jgi:hypothetical protein
LSVFLPLLLATRLQLAARPAWISLTALQKWCRQLRIPPAAALFGLIYVTSIPAANALPSCSLVTWVSSLNHTANAYVSALGTPEQQLATTQFRQEMERHPRERLLEHINAADLDENKAPLLDFISARRRLLDLSRDNWPQMAERLGKDPQFIRQSASMTLFLSRTDCIESEVFNLNMQPEPPSLLGDFATSVINVFKSPPPPQLRSESQRALTFDADDFDTFEAARYHPPAPSIFDRHRARALAVACGFFAFFTAMLTWFWLKYTRRKERSLWHECQLPMHVFDGATPLLSSCFRMTKKEIKCASTHHFTKGDLVLITLGMIPGKAGKPAPLKRRGRVSWVDSNKFGVKISPKLKSVEFTSLCGSFTQRIQNLQAPVLEQYMHGIEKTDLSGELQPKNADQSDQTISEQDLTAEEDKLHIFLRKTYGVTTIMVQSYLNQLIQSYIDNAKIPEATDDSEADTADQLLDGITIKNTYHQAAPNSENASSLPTPSATNEGKTTSPPIEDAEVSKPTQLSSDTAFS